MVDRSNFIYKDLLTSIEYGCQQIGEKRDYVEYLLSMEQAVSIEELIKKYDNIFKLLAVITYGSNKVPSGWYITERWGYYMPSRVQSLNQYFNDNVLRLFKSDSNHTQEKLATYLVNLRDSHNTGNIQSEIIKNIECEERFLLLKLCNARNGFYNTRKELVLSNKSSLLYSTLRKEYYSYLKRMVGNGRLLDIAEISLKEDLKISNNYEELKVEYQTDLEREKEELERKEEEKTQKMKNKTAKTIFMAVVLIGIFCLLAFVVESLGGPIGIIIIIGMIGLVPKIFLTGKL